MKRDPLAQCFRRGDDRYSVTRDLDLTLGAEPRPLQTLLSIAPCLPSRSIGLPSACFFDDKVLLVKSRASRATSSPGKDIANQLDELVWRGSSGASAAKFGSSGCPAVMRSIWPLRSTSSAIFRTAYATLDL